MQILGTKHVEISEHIKIPELGSTVKTGWDVQEKSDTCIMSYNTHSSTQIFYSKHETTTCTQQIGDTCNVFVNAKKRT